MLKFLSRRRVQEGSLRQQYDKLVKAGAVADLSTADEGRLESLMQSLGISTNELAADVETAKAEQAVVARIRELTPLAENVPAKQAEWEAATRAYINYEAETWANRTRVKRLLELHGAMLPMSNERGNALVWERDNGHGAREAGAKELSDKQGVAFRSMGAAKTAAQELAAICATHPHLFPQAVASH